MLSQIYSTTTLLEGERFVTLSADCVLFAKKTGAPAEAESFGPCLRVEVLDGLVHFHVRDASGPAVVVCPPTLLRPFLFAGWSPTLPPREGEEGGVHSRQGF